jgi:hypothetical protein
MEADKIGYALPPIGGIARAHEFSRGLALIVVVAGIFFRDPSSWRTRA